MLPSPRHVRRSTLTLNIQVLSNLPSQVYNIHTHINRSQWAIQLQNQPPPTRTYSTNLPAHRTAMPWSNKQTSVKTVTWNRVNPFVPFPPLSSPVNTSTVQNVMESGRPEKDARVPRRHVPWLRDVYLDFSLHDDIGDRWRSGLEGGSDEEVAEP